MACAPRDRPRPVGSGSTPHDHHDAASRFANPRAFAADHVLAADRRARNACPKLFQAHGSSKNPRATQPNGLLAAGRSARPWRQRSKKRPPRADRRVQIPIASLRQPGPFRPAVSSHAGFRSPAPERPDHARGGRRPKPFTFCAIRCRRQVSDFHHSHDC